MIGVLSRDLKIGPFSLKKGQYCHCLSIPGCIVIPVFRQFVNGSEPFGGAQIYPTAGAYKANKIICKGFTQVFFSLKYLSHIVNLLN